MLVEAVLSAVVIAVGLVFISRGLANHLRAIRTVEDYQTLLALAQGKLRELEGLQGSGAALPAELAGTFAEPYGAYRWEVASAAREDVTDPDGRPLASDVTVTVARTEPTTASVQLGTVWPGDWVP